MKDSRVLRNNVVRAVLVGETCVAFVLVVSQLLPPVSWSAIIAITTMWGAVVFNTFTGHRAGWTDYAMHMNEQEEKRHARWCLEMDLARRLTNERSRNDKEADRG